MTGLEPYPSHSKNSILPIVGVLVVILVGGILLYSTFSNPAGDVSPFSNAGNTDTGENESMDEGTDSPMEGEPETLVENTGDVTPPLSGNESSIPGPGIEDEEEQGNVEAEENPTPENDSVSLFITPDVNTSLEFCPQMEDFATHVKQNMLPSEYFEKSPQKANLEIWKELLMKRNNIKADYLESFLRIANAEVIPASESNISYFRVDYYFVADWFSVPISQDGFSLEDQNGNTLTTNQIKGLFDKTWGDPSQPFTKTGEKTTRYALISDIRPNGKMIAKLVPCHYLLPTFKSLETSLSPQKAFYDPISVKMLVFAKSPTPNETNHCPEAYYSIATEDIDAFISNAACLGE